MVIVTLFISAESRPTTVADLHSALEALGVTPLTRADAFNVLINPFVEKYKPVVDYACEEISVKGDGTKGMDQTAIRELIEEVAAQCLEIGCKVNDLAQPNSLVTDC